MKKGAFHWDDKCDVAFESLKQAFTTDVTLRHFDPTLETWLETDASDRWTAAVLSQVYPDGLRPVAYMSKKMSPAECNYEIYDKELLAIVQAFEEWRPELSGRRDETRVLSDHKNLEYFMTTKKLNRRQARWAEFLHEFNFKITYRPGKQSTKPDSLTRPPDDTADVHEDIVLRPQHLSPGMHQAVRLATLINNPAAPQPVAIESNWERQIDELLKIGYAENRLIVALRQAKDRGDKKLPTEVTSYLQAGLEEITTGEDGYIRVRGKVFVPLYKDLRTKIIKRCHDDLTSGHGGKTSTYGRVRRFWYWPNAPQDCARYTKNCPVCLQAKKSRTKKQGLLQPLPIPERPFLDISVDFIVALSPCTRAGTTYTNIMVVVDRLTKLRKFVPMSAIRAPDVADAFRLHVWSEWGFPVHIVSDRGTQFVSQFWHRLCQRCGTDLSLSTSNHPESDGQTENANGFLEQYLRCYVNYAQDDWVDFLPTAQFFANMKDSETTGVSPFFATYGFEPRSLIEPPQAASSLNNR